LVYLYSTSKNSTSCFDPSSGSSSCQEILEKRKRRVCYPSGNKVQTPHNTEHLQLMTAERQLSGAFTKLQKVTFVVFVPPHGTWLPLDGFSGNLIFVVFFSKIRLGNSKTKKNLTKRTGTLHEYHCTLIISG
jgi:hypothetical protein